LSNNCSCDDDEVDVVDDADAVDTILHVVAAMGMGGKQDVHVPSSSLPLDIIILRDILRPPPRDGMGANASPVGIPRSDDRARRSGARICPALVMMVGETMVES